MPDCRRHELAGSERGSCQLLAEKPGSGPHGSRTSIGGYLAKLQLCRSVENEATGSMFIMLKQEDNCLHKILLRSRIALV